MTCNQEFAIAYAKAVEADMEAHHERMHTKDLEELTALELNAQIKAELEEAECANCDDNMACVAGGLCTR